MTANSRLLRNPSHRVLPLLALTLGLIPAVQALASEPSATSWKTDYSAAVLEAQAEEKMLLIFFHREGDHAPERRFEQEVVTHPTIAKLLDNYTLAKLPVTTEVQFKGKPIRLLSHGAFVHLEGKPGVAIVDYAHVDTPEYGHTVSQFIFRGERPRNVQEMQVILTLPQGTLTQRTLIYAVRTHPERPRSTNGILRRLLAGETHRHSQHQAAIQSQGHHQWDSRFQMIKAQLPGNMLPVEVCAESWPGQNLEDAAIECVRSWRHSSGHWSAVSSESTYYGYDMKRGRNGIWYATGIFARNR